MASATRVYGEENMATMWGSMTPVDEARLWAVDEGDRIEMGEKTPGRASLRLAGNLSANCFDFVVCQFHPWCLRL